MKNKERSQIMDTTNYTCNLESTRKKRRALEAYYLKEVLGKAPEYEILCNSYEDNCMGKLDQGLLFYPGQLSHIGDRYDLSSSTSSIRIVVAGKEYGANDHIEDTDREGRVSVSERVEMLKACADKGYSKRNPHMKGTTLLLQTIFHIELAKEEYIKVNGSLTHVFDAYSMVNVLLCSRCKPGPGREAARSANMIRNCLRHFKEAMIILQPTIIIFQGFCGSDLVEILEKYLKVEVQKKSDNLCDVTWDGIGNLKVCGFKHPARNWFAPDHKYFTEVVVPNIEKVREAIF